MNVLHIAKLMLDVQAPSLDECWSDGCEVSSEVSLDANPYKPGSANHHHWSEGWWAGFYENDSSSGLVKIENKLESLHSTSANDDIIDEFVVESK